MGRRRSPDRPDAGRRISRRSVLVAGTASAGVLIAPPIAARAATSASAAPTGTAPAGSQSQATKISVASGETYVVSQTTRAGYVSIAEGAVLTAPSGYSLSMTVDGVETGQALTATGGAATAFVPGTWHGDIVLTVAATNDVPWQGLTFPVRQALYVDSGVVAASSVPAAVTGGRLTGNAAQGVGIASTGQCFDGLYVAGGSYTMSNSNIALAGDGRCDFVGYGAAVLATGTGTALVLDGVTINNRGVVRTGVISDGGAVTVVKNSSIQTRGGQLPDDYQATVDLEFMESCPWMLGIQGTVRATNLLGDGSVAGYINSSVSSDAWGVLSTDSGSNCLLTAINSSVSTTGTTGGYGSYAIGNATEWFLGVHYDVGTYACIFTGGTATYGDSTREAIESVNSTLGLGLTAREIAALPRRATVINSRRWGFMWHDWGTLTITGGTRVDSPLATFLSKGQQTSITVDGSQGARLNPGNGIIMQVIDNDDPGPVVVDGNLVNQGVYTQPTGEPAKDAGFDVTAAHSTDAAADFSDIALTGDFYNGMRADLNMVLTFDRSTVEGVISATLAEHHVSTITSANYEQLGVVSNTPQAVVNNGVIVKLGNGSRWIVTGTSYLSSLTLDAGSALVAPHGRKLTMTVDGAATAIAAGAVYSGAITLTVA